MVENFSEITDDEAALYDRQIRLWGLDAQKRLRTCRVLLVGVNGLGAEVTKNIVLAGVKSLTLMDNECVSDEDSCSQFLVSAADIGKNRAESSLSQAQQLNPMVEMNADTESISDKDDKFFLNFNVVILTNCNKENMLRLDELCRKNNIQFFAGNVFGYFGYSFTDLGEHTYLDEIKTYVSDCSDEPSSKKPKQETKILKKAISFSSLKNALDKDWNTEKASMEFKKLSSSYFILQSLLKFQNEVKRKPSYLSKMEDMAILTQMFEEIVDKMGVGRDRVNNSFLNSVFAELSPVCAVVGGVLAQEVIKAVTCKDAPHNNFFFFNALEDSGIVECIG